MALTVLLRCEDLEKTRAYYRDHLGFTLSDSAEGTLTAVLEDCRLVFTTADLWGSAPQCSGTIYLQIGEVDRYFEQIKDQVQIAWPLQDMPYGSREFGVRECNGYWLGFAGSSADKS